MIGAAISGANALLQTGMGIYDRFKASQISDARPEYDIPEAQTKSLKNAAMMAGMKESPQQSLIEAKLRGSTASSIDTVKQMGGGAAGMGAALSAYGNEQNQLTDIAIDNAKNWQQNQLNYQSQLGKMAGYEDKKWQWDKGQEYEDRMQTKGYLEQSGNNAITSGLNSLGSTVMGAEDSKWMKDYATGIEDARRKQLESTGGGGGGVSRTAAPQSYQPPTLADYADASYKPANVDKFGLPIVKQSSLTPNQQQGFNPYTNSSVQDLWNIGGGIFNNNSGSPFTRNPFR